MLTRKKYDVTCSLHELVDVITLVAALHLKKLDKHGWFGKKGARAYIESYGFIHNIHEILNANMDCPIPYKEPKDLLCMLKKLYISDDIVTGGGE